jgi:GT2 family glycosyltransferase
LASSTAELLVYATVLYWQPRELELLERCVGSLLGQVCDERLRLRVVLVDNGTGLRPHLRPDERLEQVALRKNRGFAGGHNTAMLHAFERGAEYVLLFNSDAVADRNVVQQLVAAAEAAPDAAFVGPLIVRAADPTRVESAGQGFDTRFGRHTELGRGRRVSELAKACTREVDALSGCALLARCAAVRAIGLLDEDLFAYFEDMDWCLRARRAGYRALLVPSAKVWHRGQASTGGSSPISTYYSVRNHMTVAARYATPVRGTWVMPLVLAYQLAYLARSPRQRTRQHLLALASGARAAWAGEAGALRSSANRH